MQKLGGLSAHQTSFRAHLSLERLKTFALTKSADSNAVLANMSVVQYNDPKKLEVV